MKNIWLDTDIGCDCDDAGALAILHELQDQGRCTILGITSCTSRIAAPGCIDAINNFYRHPDIPIGQTTRVGFMDRPEWDKYATAVATEFPNRYGTNGVVPDAVALLNEQMNKQPDQSVTLIAIGPLTNLADWLSNKEGKELAAQKITELYVMGGSFPTICNGLENYAVRAECNIVSDIPAARQVIEEFPAPCILIPWELGTPVISGQPFIERANIANPVRRAYELYCNAGRESWDPCTVFAAVVGERLWKSSPLGRITIDEEGVCRFYTADGGHQRYLMTQTPPEKVAHALNALMTER